MKPLKIALCGMDQQQARSFAKTFDSLRRRLGRTWLWAVDAYENADLVAIDIDTVYGHIDWLKATARGLRTVVYTVAETVNDADLILHKPLKTAKLAEVLVTVAAEHGFAVTVAPPQPEPPPKARPPAATMNAAYDASVPAPKVSAQWHAKAAPPAPGAKPVVAVEVASAGVAAASKPVAMPAVAAAEPAADSVAAWLLAQRNDYPVSIRVRDDEWVLDVERDTYHGPTTLKPLHPALKQPPGVLRTVDVETLEQARRQADQPLARLRWYAAMCASPGMLSPGLDGEARFKLSRWPRIEREFPRHFRIATAMMKQADQIDEIASASGAPRADVIDFINAYDALGYVASDSQPDVGDAARGVMARIRNPFAR